MKYRTDFVTNSSSSSFICEICGRNEYVYDESLEEVDMCECVNGHIICNGHRLPNPSREFMIQSILGCKGNMCSAEELNKMSDEELFNDLISDGGYYDVPEEVCPVCQFVEYSEDDLATYLLKEYKIPRDEVFAEVKKYNKRRKKLYDSEYISYVCQKYNIQSAAVVSEWKDKFGTYSNFRNYLRGK